MGRDQEAGREEDDMMISNIGKEQLGLEKQKIDNIEESQRTATSNSGGTQPRYKVQISINW